ncbi:MAG TPA: 5-methyltetrahydropteroyltriglutamate--homocysteine S-methyltransferase [Hyphomonadaceae bacterium]|jgi:5-methyltetrahydropteroyltriglutamate--homocysteine methyltransferase|nr:5-methyltetrahydropteroyltriglutamate--homocysteine S-methyltransferase [Hyphomonadaceae bacterium]
METATAPFRADHVGSLLRTARLKQAREKKEARTMSAVELRGIEDEEIEKIVRKQESIGLRDATDGEFRRAFWHYDFLEHLDGVESYWGEATGGVQFKGVQLKPKHMHVTGKIGFSDHPMLAHFSYLKSIAKGAPKMTIPSPSMLYYRMGREMFTNGAYPNLEDYYRDMGAAYAKAVGAFAGVGCRYLQLDDVSFAYLCDKDQRKMLSDRGDDPNEQLTRNIGMINTAIAGRPKDMRITMHLCRGNFRSTFIASGGYEPVAEALFNKVNVDGYFMEWDTDRAGGFEPLRFLPKGKTVVLGLITSKTGGIEKKDDLKRRIDEAAKYAPIEQLCLSPQCGFASTEEGNTLAEDEQWRKLELAVETAREVWN